MTGSAIACGGSITVPTIVGFAAGGLAGVITGGIITIASLTPAGQQAIQSAKDRAYPILGSPPEIPTYWLDQEGNIDTWRFTS